MKDLPTILCYSHTDVSDVWSAFFGRLKKYMPESRITLLVNKDHEKIPHGVKKIFYDDKVLYTERLKHCLSYINGDDVVLFMHEDMILYDHPSHEEIKKYFMYVKNNIFDGIKLSHSGDDAIPSNEDKNLFYGYYSRFSIQPTIIKTSTFNNILKKHSNCNIWDLEISIESSNSVLGKYVMSRKRGDKKRGIIHYDSDVLPYIATGIVKGKWNVSEYPEELKEVFEEYDINPLLRGLFK